MSACTQSLAVVVSAGSTDLVLAMLCANVSETTFCMAATKSGWLRDICSLDVGFSVFAAFGVSGVTALVLGELFSAILNSLCESKRKL